MLAGTLLAHLLGGWAGKRNTQACVGVLRPNNLASAVSGPTPGVAALTDRGIFSRAIGSCERALPDDIGVMRCVCEVHVSLGGILWSEFSQGTNPSVLQRENWSDQIGQAPC